jgi:predicted amidohydrolase YtcJ
VAHPDLTWLLGRGWQYSAVGPSGLPNKEFLDAVIPDRPVYLESYDGHTWWANSRALKLAGITRESPDPPGGAFVRDPRDGEPTGVIKEDAADNIVRKSIPRPRRQQLLAALQQGMREANRVGLVRAISPDGVHVEGGDFGILDVYDELLRQERLTLRFYIASRLEPPQVSPEQIQKIADATTRHHDQWLSAGAAKFFLDGVIESHTAAMLAPYSDDLSQSGKLLWDPARYKHAVTQLDARGFQIFTAFGSDWPIVTLNPWPGVQNALTRQTAEGEPPGGFVPRQRISLQSAINAYTLGAAFAGHREKTEGSLEPGKLADLIILSQDLFKIEPSDIGKTEVLLTMVGGKVVYQSPAWVAAHPASPKADEARP